MTINIELVMIVRFKKKVNGDMGYECHEIESDGNNLRLIYCDGVEITVPTKLVEWIKPEHRISEILNHYKD
jgi:hypothetical protein